MTTKTTIACLFAAAASALAVFPLPTGFFAPTLNPDVAAWRDTIRSRGGSVSDQTVERVNRLAVDLSASGVWTNLTDVGLFVGVGDLTAALVKVKTASTTRVLTNVGFLASAYSPSGTNAGLMGNGTNYLNTMVRQTNELSTNSISMWVYSPKVGPDIAAAPIGNAPAQGGTYHVLFNAGTTTFRAGNVSVYTFPGRWPGFLGTSRISNTTSFLYANGTNVSNNNQAPDGITTNVFTVFARGPTVAPYNSTITFYALGTGLTTNQADVLYRAVHAMMTEYGANAF